MYCVSSQAGYNCASSRQALYCRPAAAHLPKHVRARLLSAGRQQPAGVHQTTAWQQLANTSAAAWVPCALKDEEAEIDRIAREASQSDIWGNELVGNAFKVAVAGAVVAVLLLIANLAKPLYENTIKSFPTPAEYEQYEQREEEGLL